VAIGTLFASLLAAAIIPATASAEVAAGGPKKFQATLVVLPADEGHVEIQRSGKDAFKQAENEAKLNEGDTVRTDDEGHAEIDYSDDSYTRLDVNTTFTLVKLVEDEGKRQVATSLDLGRAYTRTEALTESESLEEDAGGTTAAVVGTAWSRECTIVNGVITCNVLGVLHNLLLTFEEQQKILPELNLCEYIEGEDCESYDPQTLQDMINNAWTQLNLQRDLLERGLGPGPFSEVGGVQAEQEIPIDVGGIGADDYTPEVAGEVATQTGTGTATGQLPFTGSNDSPSWILVGLVLTAIGAIFVVATRRRASVARRS
jgi:LPXTG-motif cell wall-anchored protein